MCASFFLLALWQTRSSGLVVVHILFLPPFFPCTFHAWAVRAEAEAELGVEAVGVLHLVELLFAVGCEEASVHGVFPSALEGEGEAFRHAPVVVEAGA